MKGLFCCLMPSLGALVAFLEHQGMCVPIAPHVHKKTKFKEITWKTFLIFYENVIGALKIGFLFNNLYNSDA